MDMEFFHDTGLPSKKVFMLPFLVTSQWGYRYILVGIHIDGNYIFCEMMKNRMEGEMINAYQKMVDRMQLAGLGLKHHRLDNECSNNFKKCI